MTTRFANRLWSNRHFESLESPASIETVEIASGLRIRRGTVKHTIQSSRSITNTSHGSLWLAALLLTLSATLLQAQPKTRTEEIEQQRREKMAVLWPERESPLVDKVNGMVEKGLLDGAQTGKGKNGWQVTMGGMRPGQGASFGAGYRRTDILRDLIGVRGTARGTFQQAYMFDLEIDVQKLRSEKSYLDFYLKYENSPQMDYYGPGFDSSKEDITSYRLEDTSADLRGGIELLPNLVLGANLGGLLVHTGRGRRGGVPSTDEVFDSAPGLNRNTTFGRWGADVIYDYLDNRNGPRSGGFYAARFDSYHDLDRQEFSFRQWQFEARQFIPYFNKSRVIALRIRTTLSFANSGQLIPFYRQPSLGGNDSIRGFDLYRFYDDHSVLATIEHRWHSFSGLDVALFVDAGKVAARKADLDLSDLAYSGGIGFRFKIKGTVVSRIDFAAGREGFRAMWTFNDIFTRPFE